MIIISAINKSRRFTSPVTVFSRMSSSNGSCSSVRIGTHSGTFHCDETLACSMLKMLPQLLEGDEYKTLVPKMIKSYLSSSTMGALALGYIENNIDPKQAEKGLDVVVDSVKEFTKTKSFDRLMSIINMVMQAKDTEEIAKVSFSNGQIKFASTSTTLS